MALEGGSLPEAAEPAGRLLLAELDAAAMVLAGEPKPLGSKLAANLPAALKGAPLLDPWWESLAADAAALWSEVIGLQRTSVQPGHGQGAANSMQTY